MVVFPAFSIRGACMRRYEEGAYLINGLELYNFSESQ